MDQASSTQSPPRPTLLWRRCFAFAADILFVGLLRRGILYTYSSFLKVYFYQLPLEDQAQIVSEFFFYDIFMSTMVFLGYFTFSFYWGEGKSLGKWLWGLKVETTQGSTRSLSLNQAYFRAIGYLICYLGLGAPFLVTFLRKDRRGIPDFLSGSRTVFDKKVNLTKAHELYPVLHIQSAPHEATGPKKAA